MPKNNLKVSAIIIAYNGEKTIASAIRSVLDQDYPKECLEIIAVDNNSKDKTADVIKQFPVLYVSETDHQSPAAARNKGASVATGEILAFLDADQTADKLWIKKLVEAFDDPTIGGVGGQNTVKSNQNSIAYQTQAEEWLISDETQARQEHDHKIGGGNSAVRKKAFDELKGFDITLFNAEDFDFYHRLIHQLGFKTKLVADAVVYNEIRGWRSLLKREYRIGIADANFAIKYHIKEKTILNVLLKALKRTFLGLGVIVISLFKFMPWAIKRQKILTILFDIAMQWVNLGGRMHYLIRQRQGGIPPDW